MPRHLLSRPAATVALTGAALAAACGDPAADHLTAGTAPRGAVAAPAAPDSVVTSFAWLSPTLSASAAAPADTFDAPALARLAVEVCALGSGAAAGGSCAGAPVARYTAATAPYAQQLRADTVRQFFLVYWNTGAAPAGLYRARVLDGAREVGAVDVRVGATAADLAGVDRATQGAVVRGGQLALRFRAGRRTVPRPPADTPGDPSADTTTSALLRAAAEELYAAADSGVDVTPGVHAVLGRILPVLGEGEAGELDARLAEGLPVAFDFQADLVGRGFMRRTRVPVESFAAGAADAGATLQGGGALTAAALTDLMRPVAALERHGPETLVPALVLALGQARARQAGVAAPDPVWGDGQLDAMQTALLLYSLQFSGLDAAAMPNAAPPAPATPLAASARARFGAAALGGVRDWIGGKITDLKASKGKIARGMITGEIGKKIEMPLTWSQAAKASACGSVLLESYKFDVAAAPTGLGRDGLGLPTVSDVDATLRFDFVPNVFGALVLAKIGCVLPPNGAAPGKRVVWSATEELPGHGVVEHAETVTDAAGRTRDRYVTLPEVVPAGMRLLAKDATGTVNVRATGLIPGWKNLERSVGVGVQNPTDAGVRLMVRHYTWPSRVRVDAMVALASSGGPLGPTVAWDVGRAASRTMARRERGGAVWYMDEAPARYTHFAAAGSLGGCSIVATGTRAGSLGLIVVGADPAGDVAPMTAMAYPGDGIGAELFNHVCPGGIVIPNSAGGFYTSLLGVYAPRPSATLPLRTDNPVTAWTVEAPGVAVAHVDRRVGTPFGATREQATYRLTFEP